MEPVTLIDGHVVQTKPIARSRVLKCLVKINRANARAIAGRTAVRCITQRTRSRQMRRSRKQTASLTIEDHQMPRAEDSQHFSILKHEETHAVSNVLRTGSGFGIPEPADLSPQSLCCIHVDTGEHVRSQRSMFVVPEHSLYHRTQDGQNFALFSCQLPRSDWQEPISGIQS
jgi:hypothetical protein